MQSNTVRKINGEFSLNDHGLINFFLGYKASKMENEYHLSQRKYTVDILTKTGMLSSKASPSPMC